MHVCQDDLTSQFVYILFFVFFNQHIQCRLRTTKEKPLTGMQTVLRPKWKIKMSIIIWTGTINKLRRTLKPLDGMQTIHRHCKSVTLFFSVQTEVSSCSRSYTSWKGCKDHIWNNFPNTSIAIVDDITPAKTGRSSRVICWLQL